MPWELNDDKSTWVKAMTSWCLKIQTSASMSWYQWIQSVSNGETDFSVHRHANILILETRVTEFLECQLLATRAPFRYKDRISRSWGHLIFILGSLCGSDDIYILRRPIDSLKIRRSHDRPIFITGISILIRHQWDDPLIAKILILRDGRVLLFIKGWFKLDASI